MKLLFDQNLSPRLVDSLDDIFPESAHVRSVGLARATDSAVWYFARDNEFALVSKDSDFHQMSVLEGWPPKVIWIRRGNCTTLEIAELLRLRATDVQGFHSDPDASFLALA